MLFRSVLIGSYDQTLYAVNAKTGKQVWKYETSGPVHATPAILDGVAYIAGCDENFRAIRLSDGQEVYHVPSGSYTGSSPAISGTRAYFGTYGNEVFGVDMKLKKIIWRYEHPVRKFPYQSSAAVSNGKVVLGGRDKNVHAIDANTGKGLWTFATKSRVESSPAIANGHRLSRCKHDH